MVKEKIKKCKFSILRINDDDRICGHRNGSNECDYIKCYGTKEDIKNCPIWHNGRT